MKELLCKLIEIPSFSGQETAAADFLQGWLSSEGYQIHRCGNNLWMESEPSGAKPTILLNAHIDTVKPASGYTRDPFSPSIEGEYIYGLGSNDDGGSLVTLLETYKRLSAKPQAYRLVFSATACEETGAAGGIDMVLSEAGRIDLGIIGEPTGMQMAVAEKGLMVLDCTAHGISGHAARNEGDNAIYKAMRDIEWFEGYQFDKVSDFFGQVQMSVTQVNAGTQHNVIPDRCSFVVDIRSNGMYTNLEILDTVRRNVACEVTPRSTLHNGSSIEWNHPVVLRGRSLGLGSIGSPTFSNCAACDFPTLKIGPGESSRSHAADEYILTTEMEQAVNIYFRLLDGLKI